jgi:hypothetical protein
LSIEWDQTAPGSQFTLRAEPQTPEFIGRTTPGTQRSRRSTRRIGPDQITFKALSIDCTYMTRGGFIP